ncbi:MAG: PIN domain-containing protein [Myxococcales bacterium]|nr:PIN domain-containing protein [Myxococcales bacterium]
MVRTIFYDTWGFMALANARDPDHDVAGDANRRLLRDSCHAVTSDYVLDETVTGLHNAAGAACALAFIDFARTARAGGMLELIAVTEERRERAVVIFERLAGDTPRLSFTDCTSLSLMDELAIPLAFSRGPHFHRLGPKIRPLFEPVPGGGLRAVWPAGARR